MTMNNLLKNALVVGVLAPLTALVLILPALAEDNANAAANVNNAAINAAVNSNVNAPGAGQNRDQKNSHVKVEKVIDVACLQAAIEKRDVAIGAALDARYVATKTALASRKDALKAYQLLDEVLQK